MNKDIERKLAKLEALEAGGVDSWDGYDDSLEDWRKDNLVDELQEDFIRGLEDVLAEAKVDEPAGQGCGYSIDFEDSLVVSLLEIYTNSLKEEGIL